MSTANTADPLTQLDHDAVKTQVRELFTDSYAWLHHHWLQALIAIAIAVVIGFGLLAVRNWGLRICRRGEGVANWYSILGRALAKTGNFFIVMAAARLVLGYANAPELVNQTARFLFTIAAALQAAVWLREIVFGMIEQRTLAEGDRGEAISSALGLIRLLVTIALFAVALVVVLSNLGVNVTGLVAGLGVGGIAIGLAAQGIFADLFAALSIIFDRPFRVGENIAYDGTIGTVEAIGLKSTRIRSFNGELRVISNKSLLDKEIQNITDRDHIRISFTLGLAYETSPESFERLPALLREIVERNDAKAVRAGFSAFGASTLDFEMIFDVPGSDWAVAHATRDRIAAEILRRFAAENLVFAFPSQTTYTAAPDGRLIMPYPNVQPVVRVDPPAAGTEPAASD